MLSSAHNAEISIVCKIVITPVCGITVIANRVGSSPANLVTKNAGWRNKRPVINSQKCVGCLRCYMYCPDGVIYKKDGKVDIDYDFCKGCGICRKVCKIGAIEMEAEK